MKRMVSQKHACVEEIHLVAAEDIDFLLKRLIELLEKPRIDMTFVI